MSDLFREVIVEPSKWAMTQDAKTYGPLIVKIGRVDLYDDEQREEIDDKGCPSCNNQKDILKIKSYMEDTPLAIIYHCPCAHIWYKDLQVGEKDETTEQVDEGEEVPDKAIDSASDN